MTPGEYLRQRRMSEDRSLAHVAITIGLSIQYLSDVERGRRPILADRARLEALCEACGADLREVDRLAAREGTPIETGDLSPTQRERAFAFVEELRAGRAG